jgi:hypothetical protein
MFAFLCVKVTSCSCTLENCTAEFCRELSQLTDPELRDAELKLLLATRHNLPLQAAVDWDNLHELHLAT